MACFEPTFPRFFEKILEKGIEPQLKEYGGSILYDPLWQERRLWPVNVSSEFNYDDLQELGLAFTKSFQTMETFYRQKLYGYFSPGVSYQEFVEHAERYGIERLPFSRNAEEARAVRNQLKDQLDRHQKKFANQQHMTEQYVL